MTRQRKTPAQRAQEAFDLSVTGESGDQIVWRASLATPWVPVEGGEER